MIVHFYSPEARLGSNEPQSKGQQVEGFQGSPITRDTYWDYCTLWKFTRMLKSGSWGKKYIQSGG